MSFWNKFKKALGMDVPEETKYPEMRDALVTLMNRGAQFNRFSAGVARSQLHPSPPGVPIPVAEELHYWIERGLLAQHNYKASEAAGVVVYHPSHVVPNASTAASAWARPSPSGAPSGGTPAPTGAPIPTPAAGGGYRAAPPKPRASKTSPYATGKMLTLTQKELRAQAMKVVPWRTTWIGRVDVIPPVSDTRTALVDRGLVLRGLLTQEELDEIHRIGDLWLEHRDAMSLIRAKARSDANEAIQAKREERLRIKEQKREEARKKREEHARQVAHRRATDIIHLGQGVSGDLGDRRANVEKLTAAGLPTLATPGDVALFLGTTIPQLRWLAYRSEASASHHYAQFKVPKRTGGERTLSAPMPLMKAAQQTIRTQLLDEVNLHHAAHGFVAERSTVTNASQHQGRAVVINMDLKDFFPSVSFPRVRGVFKQLGYSPCAATILALICTESPRTKMTYDGKVYWVETGDRALPQGAPTSPALSNLVCRRLDSRLQGFADKHGFTYTRYADDLTFSGGKEALAKVAPFMGGVKTIVTHEGFTPHPMKQRVQRQGGRQDVTGINVNRADKLTVKRTEVRELRAILHNAKKTNLATQNRKGVPNFKAHIAGRISYVAMVNKEQGAKLQAAFDALS